MPQLVLLAAAGAALYVAIRFIGREMERVGQEMAAKPVPIPVRRADAVRLERDPETGIYRPRR